jgi:hypothetical protein
VDPNSNPKVLAGSESEKSSDSDTDSDPDTVVERKSCEKSQIKHLKEKKIMFFYSKNFFSDVQVPEHILKQLEAGTIWKNLGSK